MQSKIRVYESGRSEQVKKKKSETQDYSSLVLSYYGGAFVSGL